MSRWSTTRLAGLVAALALGCLQVVAPVAAAPGCTGADGQASIDQGRYDAAVREFGCLILADPTSVEGHRGRIEALVLLGRYADAVSDGVHFNAIVVPAHPNAQKSIVASYSDRLAGAPTDIPALTGATFARWWFFDYPAAVQLASRLLDLRPDSVAGTLFRGSSRLLHHRQTVSGVADLERAIQLDSGNPSVHYIVADAYTYGLSDPRRAFDEATFALDRGLDTARVHAILAAALNAFGQTDAAAEHIARHFELVTTDLEASAPLAAGGTRLLDLVPGRTYDVPLPAVAGSSITIATNSRDYWDSIAVLLAPDGTPVIGSDDDAGYFAAFTWVAGQTATYHLRVSFFESAATGALKVARD
jgi:tetratricopeptide (TPR) repeat protein